MECMKQDGDAGDTGSLGEEYWDTEGRMVINDDGPRL